ncbi:MAG: acyl-CoA dehydrogenase family protein [Pseudomonadota bacterium]
MLDFSPPPHAAVLVDRVRRFIDDVVIPLEADVAAEPARLESIRAELQQAAREAGVFAPRVPRDHDGLGLDWRDSALVFEAAGRSLLGPQALNCAAPDEGNMHLLHAVGSAGQKARYYAPLARGEVRSCFAMTEPAPGVGSDPSMLLTRAVRDGNGWVIDGDKWFITGADGAAFAICMARTDDGPTLFMVEAGNPGFEIVRHTPTLDHAFPGGHCEVRFAGCRVDADAVLGDVGRGYDYAQLRLGPGRLTHCMRWLGIAGRALDIAMDYVNRRDSFGRRLAQHQEMQRLVAESAIEMHASRLMIWQAAWCLDHGERALHETSMTKVFVAEAVNRIVDRALQMCGARGISEYLPLAQFYREIRGFRIYDGATEVHRASIGIRLLRDAAKPAT